MFKFALVLYCAALWPKKKAAKVSTAYHTPTIDLLFNNIVEYNQTILFIFSIYYIIKNV